jgi:hypothetical protein
VGLFGDVLVSLGDAAVLVGDALVFFGDAALSGGDAALSGGEALVLLGDALVSGGDAVVTGGYARVLFGDEAVLRGDEAVLRGDAVLASGGWGIWGSCAHMRRPGGWLSFLNERSAGGRIEPRPPIRSVGAIVTCPAPGGAQAGLDASAWLAGRCDARAPSAALLDLPRRSRYIVRPS